MVGASQNAFTWSFSEFFQNFIADITSNLGNKTIFVPHQKGITIVFKIPAIYVIGITCPIVKRSFNPVASPKDLAVKNKFLKLCITPFACPVLPDVYVIMNNLLRSIWRIALLIASTEA